MHRPAPLEVSLSPSRAARAWIRCVSLCTVALAFTLPVAWWAIAIGGLLIAVWAKARVNGLQRGRGAMRHLRIDGDHTVSITTADGRMLRGRVLPSTFVSTRLATLVWRPYGCRIARAECVLPDMLPPNDFRTLRVLLRYGRSEPTQGAPPSHA